jgi:hypothetical protein
MKIINEIKQLEMVSDGTCPRKCTTIERYSEQYGMMMPYEETCVDGVEVPTGFMTTRCKY